ncbi:hypothetical protein [Undibacterium sp. RuTC16W]|uniref:hypothetical protein n=1 Tax=Undibacterium sp. RuTC16W TaxID=3413048 RepID=UPI003BF19A89
MKMRNTMLSASLALLLAACGGSDSYTSTSPATPMTPTTPSIMDTFTKFVVSLIAGSPEDQEPQAVESITVTAPEDTESVSTT